MTPRIARGMLILIVGPSGAGKDTLIAAACSAFRGDGCIVFPQRIITRGADGGAEQHLPMTSKSFCTAERAGQFFLSWRSHGHSYALPSSIAEDLDRGRFVVVNVSRTVVTLAEERVERVCVIHVTAAPAVLAARLAARGRENADAIQPRLERAVPLAATRSIPMEINNDGAIASAAAAFIAALKRLTAAGPAETAK